MHSASPLGEFDDAMLDRLHAGLTHPIPGDPTFLAHMATIGRALIAFERRYRKSLDALPETHPEPSSAEDEAEAEMEAKGQGGGMAGSSSFTRRRAPIDAE